MRIKKSVDAMVSEIEQLRRVLDGPGVLEFERCCDQASAMASLIMGGYVDHVTPRAEEFMEEALQYARELYRIQLLQLQPGDVVEYTPFGTTDCATVTLKARSPHGSLNVFMIDPKREGDRDRFFNVTSGNVQLIKRAGEAGTELMELAVKDGLGHKCDSHLDESHMSDCEFGCKYYRCTVCKREAIIHSATYGCRDFALS